MVENFVIFPKSEKYWRTNYNVQEHTRISNKFKDNCIMGIDRDKLVVER